MVKIIKEDVSISILKANEAIAKDLRVFFKEKNIFTINIISSPGAGKTSLLEKILPYFEKEKVFVLVGDIETERDAERIRKKGYASYQIVTGGTCHLEAVMIKEAIKLIPEGIEYLFIENVGNLVCPASYDLGENLRVSMISIPEGDDKILKYPKAFLTSDLLVINKVDLLPYINFDIKKVEKEAKKIKKDIKIFKVSALKGEGVEEFVNFIKERRNSIL